MCIQTIAIFACPFPPPALRCTQSCLGYQLDDFYHADLATEAAGGTGTFFVENFRQGGDFSVFASAGIPQMSFGTNRFQKSVVTLYLNVSSTSV